MNQDQKYELYSKSMAFVNTIKNIYQKAETEDRKLTAGEKDDVGRLSGKFKENMKTLNDKELSACDLFTDEGVLEAIKIYNTPDSKGWRPTENPGDFGNTTGGETKFLAAHEKKTYRNMFHGKRENVGLDNGGFESFGEYMEAILSGRADNRLTTIVRNAVREGVPSEGGFAVPEEYAGEINDRSLERQIVRPRATVIPMKAETVKMSAWSGYSHISSLFGGLTFSYTNEGGEISDSTPKLRGIQMTAHKLAALVKPSNEVLEDASNFSKNLISAIADAASFSEDYFYLQGTGAGQPLGILNDPALITINKETGQPAKTIIFENLCKIFARMHPACLPYSEWYCNMTAIPQLLQLYVSMGVGGTHIPVLQSDGKGGFTILTRPVVFTEKLPALGIKGDILFADLSQYYVGMRKEIVIAISGHVYFATDEMAIRAILRHDGQGSWKEAVTPKNGDPLSWCVALETRS